MKGKPIKIQDLKIDPVQHLLTEDFTLGMVNKKGKMKSGALFASVIVGWDKADEHTKADIRDGVLDMQNDAELFLEAPDSWGWPQILKALGAFSSTSQARKNGWDKPIDAGFNEALIKIKKKPCIITIFKVI